MNPATHAIHRSYVPPPDVIADRQAQYATLLDIALQPFLRDRAEAEAMAERK